MIVANQAERVESFQGTRSDDSEITMYCSVIEQNDRVCFVTNVDRKSYGDFSTPRGGDTARREGSPRQTDKSAMGEKDAIDKGRI